MFEGAKKSAADHAETPALAATPAPVAAEAVKASPGKALLAVAVFGALIFAIACVAPFLGGLENVIGLVLLGIGRYEAWQINKRVPLVITGPFRVGAAPAPAAADTTG